MKRRKHKRKIVSKTHKLLILNIVLVCFFMLGIGYSLLGTNLLILGETLISRIMESQQIVHTFSPPANGSYYVENEEIDIDIVVRNNRSYSITDVTIEDEMTGDEWFFDVIEAWETKEFETSYTVTAVDILYGSIEFITTLDGTKSSGSAVHLEESYIIDSLDEPWPEPVKITYSFSAPANGSFYVEDENITIYTAVKNCRDYSIHDVEIVNDTTLDIWTINELRDWETKIFESSYVITLNDIINESVEFVTTVDGTKLPNEPIHVEKSHTIDNIEEPWPDPIKITYRLDPPIDGVDYGLGETITIYLSFRNVRLDNFLDVRVGSGVAGDEWVIDTLFTGATQTFHCTHSVTENDILFGLNIDSYAKFYDEDSNLIIVNAGHEVLNIDPVSDNLLTATIHDISSPSNGNEYDLGDEISYSISAYASGNLTMTDLSITGTTSLDHWTLDSLAPGAWRGYSSSYKVMEPDIIAGKVLLKARVQGTNRYLSNPTVSSTTQVELPTKAPDSTIDVQIVIDNEQPAYHYYETIPFIVRTQNIGNITLNNITVNIPITREEWTINEIVPHNAEEFTSQLGIMPDMVSNGQACIVVNLSGTTDETGNPTRSYSGTHCVNVS